MSDYDCLLFPDSIWLTKATGNGGLDKGRCFHTDGDCPRRNGHRDVEFTPEDDTYWWAIEYLRECKWCRGDVPTDGDYSAPIHDQLLDMDPDELGV